MEAREVEAERVSNVVRPQAVYPVACKDNAGNVDLTGLSAIVDQYLKLALTALSSVADKAARGHARNTALIAHK